MAGATTATVGSRLCRPKAPTSNLPRRARIDSYPTVERYGMVWVFLGDVPEEERFPLPEFSRIRRSGLETAHGQLAVGGRRRPHRRERASTSPTASFVHPSFGMEATAQENHIVSLEKNEFWGRSENIQYPPQFKGNWLRKRMRKDRQPTVTIPEWHLNGLVARIRIDINDRMSIIMFDANTPIDEHHTRTFATQARNFFRHGFFDRGSRKRLLKIFEEDTAIVERVAPGHLAPDLSNELSVKDDRFMSSFRAARRKLIDRNGWRIDTVRMARDRDHKVMAIPSPQRRLHPDIKWVMDTVPLVPPVARPVAESAAG